MGVDWVGVLEAIYATAPSDDAWARRLVEAVTPIFGAAEPADLICVEHSADLASIRATVAVGPAAEPRAQHLQGWAAAVGPSGLRSLYYPAAMVSTMRALVATEPPASRDKMAGIARGLTAGDMLGLVTHPEPGATLVLGAVYAHELHLSRHQRTLLTQLALHCETGFRLRRRPESVKAVLASNGKLLHREPGAPADELLASHVRRIENARARVTRRTPDAIALWHGLVAGYATLVERTEGTRRQYLLVENAPATQPFRALTRGELDAVSFAARGLSSKLVAYALGVSEPTVSARLASAATKIGLATRMELVRVAAMLTRDPRARFEHIALTTAEDHVLELLSQGLSNREIAKIRSRSMRTIANQVASILRKTSSPTRRALVAGARTRPTPAP